MAFQTTNIGVYCIYCIKVRRHNLGKCGFPSNEHWRLLYSTLQPSTFYLFQGDINSTSKANGSAVAWLLTILQNPGRNEKCEWDKLEEKKNEEITENAEDNSVRNLLIGFRKIIQLLEKSQERSFSKSDLDVIRAVWQNFFPQAFNYITFTIKWLDALTKYLTILAAGYIDLMKAGEN